MITRSVSQALYRYIQYVVVIASFVCFTFSHYLYNIDLMLISVFILFLGNILYGLENFNERIVFILFNFACFFFLFGRNVIELFSGIDWSERFEYEINCKLCNIIYLSLFCMLLGAIVANNIKDKKIKKVESQSLFKQEDFIKNLQIVSLVVYVICLLFNLTVELEKLIATRGLSYAAYYMDFKSSLPGFFLSFSALTKFCLCIFLATNPKKILAFPVLGSYVVSTMPAFIAGKRNPFLSAAILAVCYYIIRDYNRKDDEHKWLGKFEITAIIIGLPFLFAFLSLYETIRQGTSVDNNEISILDSILKLFSSQGVTYDVMGKGLLLQNDLPPTNINYTFGPIIEYFRNNKIFALIFGNSVVYTTASKELALYGNSFADTISYLSLGEKYFEGAGLGSSFMIENYIDFGYIGVAIFSLFIGFSLVASVKMYSKHSLFSFFSMVFLLQIFMLPRSSATGWVVLILYIPMYFLLFGVTFITGLTLKRYYKSKGA